MRILMIEDDERIAKPLAEDLRHQYHLVDIVTDGLEGWNHALMGSYDLILLDLMLPKLDGITLCQRLRETDCMVPILMLTAKDTTTDKILGLDAGADDYLVKPFELEELSARIRALSRRSRDTQPPILSYGQLQLNPSACQVNYGDHTLSLTTKEYMILELFLRYPNRVFTRSEILEKLWEFDKATQVSEKTVKTHITNLRHKLKAAGMRKGILKSVYGMGGYRFAQD